MKKWFFILCIATAASAAFWLRTPVGPDTAHQQQVVTHHLRNVAYGDYEARNDSHSALLSIGTPATEFIVCALDDRPGVIDRTAARIGRHVSWLRITPTTDHQIRQRAAEQLAADPLREHPAAIPALIRALTDDSAAVVEQAQQSLRRIGSEAAIPALTQALQSRNKAIRFHAAEVLRDMGTDASPATSALVVLLHDRDPTIRVVTAHALGNIGNTPALQALVATLVDKSPAVRAAAVTALGSIGHGAISSAPQVRQRLTDRDLRV